ncbi:MAG: beta-ketoacyl-ACP synthase II [Peptococcaceae bacterium]|jgi:3-oxoacyl-[acyl-carrier-protein] synthase II|nr:beta-ketoacyl-ACP synthase II [Peptococcaceae bacterium]
MEKRRVVITGLGAVTPLGHTAQVSFAAARQGACGVDKITAFDVSDHKVKLAAEVKNLRVEEHLDKKEARKLDRFTQFALIAAQEAMQDSGLKLEQEDRARIGVSVSSGIGGLSAIEREHSKGLDHSFDRVSPFFIPMSIGNMAAGHIAITYGLQGMCTCPVTACAGGTNAVGDSFRQVRDGYADVMVCGGAEASITPLGIGGFTSMKALCESQNPNRASIPFDKERNGFVMGEGAGILVLEEYEHAVKRGAKIYCELLGYGSNCDAYHITAPLPDGSGAANCMRLAMADADVKPEDVVYLNAHGTSTQLNDRAEIGAVKQVFGPAAAKLQISSTKSMVGHMLGASGAVEAVFTALTVHEGVILPTINYQVPDPDCDLDIVPNQAREVAVTVAMSNSFGFGGHNASLIFGNMKR